MRRRAAELPTGYVGNCSDRPGSIVEVGPLQHLLWTHAPPEVSENLNGGQLDWKNTPFADINAIRETQEAVRNQPELGKVTFKVKGKADGGLAMTSHTGALIQNGKPDDARDGKFSLISDEPVALLGTDTGANPAEYVLHALAGCYTVTLASMAASKGDRP